MKNSRNIGFRLLSLSLIENPIFASEDITFDFVELGDEFKSIYTTVIIGPNGTGKSNIFRIVIEIFRAFYDAQNFDWQNPKFRPFPFKGYFSMKYSMNGKVYELTNIAANGSRNTQNYFRVLIDGQSEAEAEFPNSIVANSIILTDKFPNYTKVENPDNNNEKESPFPIYTYLGLRNTPQGASTRSYVRRTVELVAKEGHSKAFRAGLEKAVDYLGLSKSLTIYYNTSNAHIFFNGSLDPDKFKEYFEELRIRYTENKTAPPFKLSLYLKIRDDSKMITRICSFCNELFHEGRIPKIHRSGSTRRLSYDILNSESHSKLSKEYEFIDFLRQLGLFYAPEIQLHREANYELQDSSSGEYHFFSSVVGLMAAIKPNSLIFIDEPEVSLHPNWQMKYLSFLRKLFEGEEYASSHIIIATHSHFLISDLDGNDSKIIGLQRKAGRVEITNIPTSINTFGWSAEEVLYIIFGVKSSRNFFVEMHLSELLGLISENSKNAVRIGQLIDLLDKIQTSEIDPLNLVIEESKEYLSRL